MSFGLGSTTGLSRLPRDHRPLPDDLTFFNHEPLDLNADERAIRLVRMLPSTRRSPIRCQILQSTKVNSQRNYRQPTSSSNYPYTALSYVWGPPEPSREIEVNGCRFAIRENLWNFLCTIVPNKTEKQFRFYFIDQLCIDQSNMTERNHQVGQMFWIYSQAEQVVAWLGKATHSSREVVECIRGSLAKFYGDSLNLIQKTDDLYSLIEQLGKLTYWERIWVVPEFIVAKSLCLQWGSETFHADQLSSKYEWMDNYRGCKFDDLSRMRQLLLSQRYYQPRLGIVWGDVLLLACGRSCDDPRDRVYGMLGLMMYPNVKPDYSKSLEAVFLDLVPQLARATTSKAAFLDLTKEWQHVLGVRGTIPIPEDVWTTRSEVNYVFGHDIATEVEPDWTELAWHLNA